MSMFATIEPAHGLLLLAGAYLVARAYRRRWRVMRLITVIDGDTYVGLDRRGRRRKLRLADHVDCPELGQRNGTAARDFVRDLAEKRPVRVQLRGRDRYGRYLARVRIAGKDLGRALVDAGLAYATRGAGLRLRLAELRARLARRGVHRGLGQKKPWQARSRRGWFGLRTRAYRSRKLKR